ncbi:MAG: hypothetical protein HY898_18905 [Deltaproteobacteria bacterium]|nr:hypothetical protein [Deltaproteobacteria bacterium]
MKRVSLVVFLILGALPLTAAPGCSSDSETPPTPATDAGADTAAPDTSQDVVAETQPDQANPDDGDTNSCPGKHGICVMSDAVCTSQGGSPHAAGNPDCIFTDGPSTCCIPPAPKPSGNGCTDRGGLCVATPGACQKTGGLMGPDTGDCGDAGPTGLCCLPPTACSSSELECCMDTYTAVPLCDRGTWICSDSKVTPTPKGTCG